MRRGMSAKFRAKISAKTLRYLIVIGLITLWELLPRSGLIAELFLPSLSSTLIAGWTDAGEYGHALAVTLYEVVVSMAFACGGGILLGAIVGSLPGPRVLIMPMVSSLYAVPLVILYPVFTVWLGIGSESKIAFASIYGFLPTMLATAAGIQTIDPQLLLADLFGSSEAIGFGRSLTSSRGESRTARFRIGESCKVFTEDHREVLPGSDERWLSLSRGGYS